MRTLTSLCKNDVRAWFTSVTTFLLDCDGVLFRSTESIPNAGTAVDFVRSRGKRVFFVTNNSTKSRTDYVEKLMKTCGIKCVEEDIVSSAYAAALHVKKMGFTKKAYVVGQAGLAAELEGVGLTVLGPGDFETQFDFGKMKPSDLDPDVQVVVVGFDGRASYYKLNMAAAYLRYGVPRVHFLATNRDATFPDTHMLLAGGGTLVAAVETAAGRPPDVVAGKPSPALMDILEASDPSLHRGAMCMVGDRLDTDIAFGNAAGVGSTLLVLTGVTHASDLERIVDDALRPTFVLDSFGDLHGLLLEAGF